MSEGVSLRNRVFVCSPGRSVVKAVDLCEVAKLLFQWYVSSSIGNLLFQIVSFILKTDKN